MKTTNYQDTFILVSDDCPVKKAQIPPLRSGEKTIASLQYDLIKNNPYCHTSDDVLFLVYVRRNDIGKERMGVERKKFFSRGQACLRSSPLVKRYGWGVHSNDQGQVALIALESAEYRKLSTDESLQRLRGMRSKKKTGG